METKRKLKKESCIVDADSIDDILDDFFGDSCISANPVEKQICVGRRNDVFVINTDSDQVVRTVHVDGIIAGVAVSHDGKKVYVTEYSGDKHWIDVIDLQSYGIVKSVPLWNTDRIGPIVVSPTSNKVYVMESHSKRAFVVNIDQGIIEKTLKNVGWYLVAATIRSDGKKVYVVSLSNRSLAIIDTDTWCITTIALSRSPLSVAVSTDGTKIYVTDQYGICELNDEGDYGKLTIDASPLKKLIGVAVSPIEKVLYLADCGTSENPGNTVYVVGIATGKYICTVTVGKRPKDILFTPDGKKVYVVNLDKTVSVIDTAKKQVINTLNL